MIAVFERYRRYKIPIIGTHLAESLNTRGGKSLRLSTEIAIYLGNSGVTMKSLTEVNQ